MKYHSPAKIIILSLILLVVFVFASLTVTVFYNAPSVTRSALEALTERLQEGSDELSIAFDSLESHMRGFVRLNGIHVKLKNQEIAHADALTLRSGFMNTMKAVLTGRGDFDLLLSGLEVTVPKELLGSVLSRGGTEPDLISRDLSPMGPNIVASASLSDEPLVASGGEEEETPKLPDFNFLIDVVDMRIVLEDLLTVEGADLSAVYSLRPGEYSAELDIPEIDYRAEDFSLFLTRVRARGTGDLSGCTLSLATEKAGLGMSDIDADLKEVALRATVPSFSDFDPMTLLLGFSSKSVEVEKGSDVYFRAEPVSLIFEDRAVRLSVKRLMAVLGSYALSSSDIFLGGDTERFEGNMSVIKSSIWKGTDEYVVIDGVSLSAGLEKGAELRAEKISVPYLGALTGDFLTDLAFTETLLEGNWKDGFSLDFSTKGNLSSTEELFNGTNFTLSLSGEYSEEKGLGAELSMKDITVPSLAETLDIELEYVNDEAEAALTFGPDARLSLSYDGTISADLDFDSFSLESLRPILSKYVPIIDAYYTAETTLTGKLGASLSPDEKASFGFSGPLDLAVALNDISFNRMKLDIVASSSMALGGKYLDVSSFNLTTDLVRVLLSGKLDLETLIPSAELSLLTTEKGTELVSLDLQDLGKREFSFLLSLFADKSVELSGNFNFADRSHLWSDALLRVRGEEYAIGFDIDFESSVVSVVNDRAYFAMKFADGFDYDAVLSFNSFRFPSGDRKKEAPMLDGDITFEFDFEDQHYRADIKDFGIRNMNFLPGSPDLFLSASLDEERILADSIKVTSDEFRPLEGRLEFLFEGKNLSASLESDSEKFLFSLTDVDSIYSGLLSLVNVDARRFGLDMGLMNVQLMGRGSSWDDIGFSGDFTVGEKDASDGPGINGKLSITEDTLRIDDFSYSRGSLSLKVPSLRIESRTGIFELPFSFYTEMVNDDRPYPVSLDLRLELFSEPGENLYRYVSRMIDSGLETLTGKILVSDIRIDDRLCTGTRSSRIESREGIFYLDGNFITGSFDPSRMSMDLDIDLDPIVNLSVEGRVSGGLDLLIGIDDLNLSSINMVMGSPILVITDDSFASGEVYLTGPFDDLKFYGYVWTDKMTCDVFWVPDDTLIAHNGLFVLWDNNIRSTTVAVTAVDKATLERSQAYLEVEVNFNPGLSFDFFQLDCYVDEGKDISLRVPVTSVNADFISQVNGHFYLRIDMEGTEIGGEVKLSDFLGSIGMHPLPEWWSPGEGLTKMHFDFTFSRNADIVFPLGPNPIFKATLDEDQRLLLDIDESGIKLNGKLRLRSGEIFYFQNFFFIREGEIEFVENDVHMIEPVINLRAQLRDFDENGDKIDIWLSFMDARLNSINPILSSSPARSTSELMSILGQTIVGTDIPQGTLGSVVSLVSTGVDVLNRIGLLDTGSDGSLQQSIRQALSLDAFSLHSNIVENIVFDAFNNLGSPSTDLAPLARYLDGTSLYIGKHLSPEFYFEALAHLVAKKNEADTSSSFLSSDLSLDIEISVEWDNPLCTVRFFTSPNYLNFQEMFDTLGFTLSKRFVF